MKEPLPALPVPAQVSLFSLALQGIQLAVFDLDAYGQQLEAPQIQVLREALPASQTRRAQALASARQAQRWVLSRYLLADCVKDPAQLARGQRENSQQARSSHPKPPAPISYAPGGQPIYPGASLSISHSGPYLALALGPQGWRLGVDCQQIISRSPSSYLLAHFHPRETAQLAQAQDQGRLAEALTRLWTRKEAFLKATGLGLSRPLAQDYLGLEAKRAVTSLGTFQLRTWDRICPDLYLSLAYCPD